TRLDLLVRAARAREHRFETKARVVREVAQAGERRALLVRERRVTTAREELVLHAPQLGTVHQRASAGSRSSTTSSPSAACTPSCRATLAASVMIGLSARTRVTSSVAVIVSPGRTGARKRTRCSRKMLP